MGHFFKTSTTRNPNYKHICQFFETIKARIRMPAADASTTAALLPKFSHHLYRVTTAYKSLNSQHDIKLM